MQIFKYEAMTSICTYAIKSNYIVMTLAITPTLHKNMCNNKFLFTEMLATTKDRKYKDVMSAAWKYDDHIVVSNLVIVFLIIMYKRMRTFVQLITSPSIQSARYKNGSLYKVLGTKMVMY